MTRSFADRVFGGVCGGLGSSWRVNSWILRVIFVVFAIASLGVGVALYIALWWVLPQESLITNQRTNAFDALLFVVTILIIVGSWVLHLSGNLTGDDGQALLYPIVAMTLSIILFLRLVRG